MSQSHHPSCYIAIDLKSFYASVECIERGLDPLTTNLVVADESRTQKTICLAVSPALKSWGIPGRPRLFEVVQKVKEANSLRMVKAPGHTFSGESCDDSALRADPSLAIAYLTAPPQMARYMEWSTRIYEVYLKYIAPEDIHVYSIDEVFIDAAQYLDLYQLSARELTLTIIRDVLDTTGITAAAGIGTNLYLCKAAMDIMAKKVEPDENGVRIAELDEISYRKQLWNHRPLTDFWRVGRGYERKLEEAGLFTMGDIAKCSIGKPGEFYNEELLYKMFGVNAELLIDHAWGWESCTMADIKAYKPESSSIGSGQVLPCAYPAKKARLVVWEMADSLSLSLVQKGLVTDQVVLTVGYDIENISSAGDSSGYQGITSTDRYGRTIPRHGHGTRIFSSFTSSGRQITEEVMDLFDQIVNPELLIRRLYLTAGHLKPPEEAEPSECRQLNLFTDFSIGTDEMEREKEQKEKERKLQEAMLKIKGKYGKNAIVKGTNLEEGATGMDRNRQIGGHRA